MMKTGVHIADEMSCDIADLQAILIGLQHTSSGHGVKEIEGSTELIMSLPIEIQCHINGLLYEK